MRTIWHGRRNRKLIQANKIPEIAEDVQFYYMPHASVHQDRDKYGLEGMGNVWKHDTMDSATASAMKVRMFKEIQDSVFIDPDISLWYLAYLFDQGYTMPQIKDLQRIINRMMLDEIERKFGDKSHYIEELRRLMVSFAPATRAQLKAVRSLPGAVP